MTHDMTLTDGTSNQVRLVDTHCHLDSPEFGADLSDVLARSRRAGVTRWINVGFLPSRWRSSLELTARDPDISCMLGVHPGHAEEWNSDSASELNRLLASKSPVAVGEIGLDFFRGETNFHQQQEAFLGQLALAATHSLPAVIHMRSAEPEMLRVLSTQAELPTLLFHSFDGSSAMVDWILAHDAWVGVGGLATKAAHASLREQLSRIPITSVVLETDSPYLPPRGVRGRRNEPANVTRIANVLSGIHGLSSRDIADITTANAERLFCRLPKDASNA